MASKLLKDDLMVLQRPGNHDIVEPHPPTTGGPYDQLKYDLDIFHFKGEDLFYTIEEISRESNQFVLREGDHMYGNLSISYPDSPDDVEKIDPAQLTLEGYKSGTDPYAAVVFKNRKGGVSAGAIQTISAVHSSSNSQRDFIKVGDQCSITKEGRIYLGGRSIVANDGSNGTSGTEGGGYLDYVDNTHWDPTTNVIVSGAMPENAHRLRWTHFGGALRNSKMKDVFKWTDDGGYFRGPNHGSIVAKYEDDINDSSVNGWMSYSGRIDDDSDMVHKKYVDDQDALYIPLSGTLDADGLYVTGAVSFDAAGGNTGSLNGAVGSSLVLSQDGNTYMTIGGTDANSMTGKSHFYKTISVESNVVENLKYPTNIHALGVQDLTDSERTHVVPKGYIDDQDDKLQNQLDSIIGISAPVGMINAYVGDDDPDGWFICNGRSITSLETALNKDFSQLKSVLGSNDLPNLAGSFLAQKKHAHSADDGNGVEIPAPTSTRGENVGTTINTHLDQRTGKPNKQSGNIILSDVNNGHVHGTGSMYVRTKSQKMANTDNGKTDGAELMNPHKSERNTMGNVDIDVAGTMSSAGQHQHVIDLTFDAYTRPQTYTINWIIKHDDG